MKRKIVSGIMLTLLLVGMLTLASNVQPVKATGTSLKVVPRKNTATINETFVINVTIYSVTNLYGFEFKLGFDNATLDIVKVDIKPFLNPPTFFVVNETGEIFGRYCYWLAISSLYPAEPTSGSGTLVTLTFNVTGLGSSVLDLYDTKLADRDALPIDHDAVDGYFIYPPGYPIADFTYSPEYPFVRETVTFNASSSFDVDGIIVRYDWDFGDGTTGTGKIINHTYTAFGTYTVTLTVTDNDGLTDTTWRKIWILSPVRIYTDKYTYSAGDTMHLGLYIRNPLARPITVCIATWLEKPDGSIIPTLHAHAVTLPADFRYSNPTFKTFVLPNIRPGVYTWHVAFLKPKTHKILAEYTAEWEFV